MKCTDIQELFGEYWDYPEDDLRRIAVEKHIKHCSQCEEEFRIWEESTKLIRTTAVAGDYLDEPTPISNMVMNRIYQDESWRIPVQDRLYSISYHVRRNVTAMIAFCLALFVFSFLFSIVYQDQSELALNEVDHSVFGLQAPQALVSSTKDESMNGHSMVTAVASLNPSFMEPSKFNVGPIHSYPHYLLVLSILGLISTMLILNWLSRTKA